MTSANKCPITFILIKNYNLCILLLHSRRAGRDDIQSSQLMSWSSWHSQNDLISIISNINCYNISDRSISWCHHDRWRCRQWQAASQGGSWLHEAAIQDLWEPPISCFRVQGPGQQGGVSGDFLTFFTWKLLLKSTRDVSLGAQAENTKITTLPGNHQFIQFTCNTYYHFHKKAIILTQIDMFCLKSKVKHFSGCDSSQVLISNSNFLGHWI